MIGPLTTKRRDGGATAHVVALTLLTGWIVGGGDHALLAQPADSLAPGPTLAEQATAILARRCVRCHQGADPAGGVDLASSAGLAAARTGATGPIDVTSPESSRLLQRVRRAEGDLARMPPPEAGPPLTPSEVAVLSVWIAAGAMPALPPAHLPPSGGSSHWAYQPIHAIVPPPVAADSSRSEGDRFGTWPAGPLDRFTLRRMREAGRTPAADATPAAWLRRVTLALTGLPPREDDVSAFEAACRTEVGTPALASRAAAAQPGGETGAMARARAVERLLASPAHAERMTAWWLDLARYGDTHGYHADTARQMSRWRDWVLDAFGEGMPFDRFTALQTAGDLLPGATWREIVPTGFHRNHMINFENGAIAEEYRTEYVVDRTDTFGTVWLGLTVGCARCHDHPTDPMTSRDYYRLAAFFNNVPENGLDGRAGNAVPVIAAPTRDQERTEAELRRRSETLAERLASRRRECGPDQRAWEASLLAGRASAPAVTDDRWRLRFEETAAVRADAPGLRDEPTVTWSEPVVTLDGPRGPTGLWTGETVARVRFETTASGAFERPAGATAESPSVLSRRLEPATVAREAGTLALAVFPTTDEPVTVATLRFVQPGPAETATTDTAATPAAKDTTTRIMPTGATITLTLDQGHAVVRLTPPRERDASEAAASAMRTLHSSGTVPTSEWSHLTLTWTIPPDERSETFPAVTLSQNGQPILLVERVDAPRPADASDRPTETAPATVPLTAPVGLDRSGLDRSGLDRSGLDRDAWTTLAGLDIGGGEADAPPFRGMIADVRLWDRTLGEAEVSVVAATDPLEAVAAKPPAERTAAERARLTDTFVTLIDPAGRRLTAERAEVERSLALHQSQYPTVMVLAEQTPRRTTYLLARGEYDQPREAATPGTPPFLPRLMGPAIAEAESSTKPDEKATLAGLATSDGLAGSVTTDRSDVATRAELASWLTRPDHPLVARVLVSRLWGLFWESDLVPTGEDFGLTGDPPLDAELLDWLAAELIASDWDIRSVLRAIALSRTYGQTAEISETERATDPENRLWARGPRLRLTAEMHRDQALAAAGRLVWQIGGPSVAADDPGERWSELAYDTRELSAQVAPRPVGADRDRRGLYLIQKRASPPVAASVLGLPSREVCTVRRSESESALTALVGLNDPTAWRAAVHLAREVMPPPVSPARATEPLTSPTREATRDRPLVVVPAERASRLDGSARRAPAPGGSPPSSAHRVGLERLVLRTLSRTPTENELHVLTTALARHEAHFHRHPDEAAALVAAASLAEGRDGSVDPAAWAAWTLVAHTMLNHPAAWER